MVSTKVRISTKGEFRVVNVEKECKNSKMEYTFDEAIEVIGNGQYNVQLLATLSLANLAMGMDMFGLPLIVTGCICEFQLSHTQRGVLTSMPFIGPVLMSYVWGYLSDTRGRRKCLMISMGIAFILAMISSFTTNWIALAIIKLISTSFSSCAQSATYTLLGESCKKDVRGYYMLLMSSVLQFTSLLIYVFGYYILELDFSIDLVVLRYTPWRLLTQVMGLPLGIVALLLLGFHESPKFLANAGRNDEALEVLKKIWSRNGRHAEYFPIQRIIVSEKHLEAEPKLTLLKSIYERTAPLFRRPLLFRTLQLSYLTMVGYATCSSLMVWFPFVANSFFSSLETSTDGKEGLCHLLVKGADVVMDDGVFVPSACSPRLEKLTFYAGVGIGLSFTLVNLVISILASYRKVLTISVLTCSFLGAVGVMFSPESVSAIMLYVLFAASGISFGLISSYYVDVFPTSYRGMAACFGVAVARASGLGGINLAGMFMLDSCQQTFTFGAGFMFSGIVVAAFLPSDKTLRKDEDTCEVSYL